MRFRQSFISYIIYHHVPEGASSIEALKPVKLAEVEDSRLAYDSVTQS